MLVRSSGKTRVREFSYASWGARSAAAITAGAAYIASTSRRWRCTNWQRPAQAFSKHRDIQEVVKVARRTCPGIPGILTGRRARTCDLDYRPAPPVGRPCSFGIPCATVAPPPSSGVSLYAVLWCRASARVLRFRSAHRLRPPRHGFTGHARTVSHALLIWCCLLARLCLTVLSHPCGFGKAVPCSTFRSGCYCSR